MAPGSRNLELTHLGSVGPPSGLVYVFEQSAPVRSPQVMTNMRMYSAIWTDRRPALGPDFGPSDGVGITILSSWFVGACWPSAAMKTEGQQGCWVGCASSLPAPDAGGRNGSYCLGRCPRQQLPSGTANSTWGIVGRLYGVVSRRRLN